MCSHTDGEQGRSPLQSSTEKAQASEGQLGTPCLMSWGRAKPRFLDWIPTETQNVSLKSIFYCFHKTPGTWSRVNNKCLLVC